MPRQPARRNISETPVAAPVAEVKVLSIVLLLASIFAVVAGLVFLFRARPESAPGTPYNPPPAPGPIGTEPAPTPRSMPPVTGAPDQPISSPPGGGMAPPDNADRARVCGAVGGKWIECGSPCHGAPPGTACILMCEPQCLCGGAQNYSCPKNETCQSRDAQGVGVCRGVTSGSGGGSSGSVGGFVGTGVVEPATPVSSAPVRPKPAGMICDAQNFICVDEAVKGAVLANPFTVKGSAIAFENTVQWEVSQVFPEANESGVVATGFVTTGATEVGTPGTFTLRAFLQAVPRSSIGELRLYELSAESGQRTHALTVPIRLSTESSSSHVYLINLASTEKGNCTDVVKVPIRIARTPLIIEGTLRALLDYRKLDHTALDGGVAAYNNLSDQTQLISFALKNGVATAVFSSGLEEGHSSSCLAGARRAQIEATLKQFPSVKSVVISVEGKTPEETLQP